MNATKDYIGNINKIYAFNFFWMFLVVIPVIVPYFLSLGFSMEQVFQLQAIFGLTVAILEVPSGYVADLFGRKKTIVVGAIFAAIGFTSLCFIESFAEFVAYEIILAISLSLVSGADVSILYDSLNYKNDDRDERTKAMANHQFYAVTAESVASVLGGLLVTISYKVVLVTHACFSWIPVFVALTLKEPPYEKMSRTEHYQNMKKVLFHVFRSDRLLTLVFINLIVWGLSTFIAVWIFQKYWQEGQINLAYFGFLWAGYNFMVGVVGKQVPYLEKKWGPIPLLLALGILPIMGYFGMAFTTGWLGVIFGLAFQFSRGITHVILKDAINWRTPSEFRATVNSLSSLFFRLGFAVIGPAVGYSIDRFGLSSTLQYVGAAFVLLYFLLLLPLVLHVRKLALEEIPT